MKEATPTTQWISLFPPDEILALWKDCEKKGDHFDHMVTLRAKLMYPGGGSMTMVILGKRRWDLMPGLKREFQHFC